MNNLTSDPSEMTTEQMAETMYGDSHITHAAETRGVELFETLGTDQAGRDALKRDFAAIQKETGLPDGTVVRLLDLYADGEVAAGRAEDPDARAGELAAEILDNNETLRTELAKRLGGPGEAEQLLARAQRFIARSPKLQKVLEQHGLGSRPEIVEAILNHVQSSGWR